MPDPSLLTVARRAIVELGLTKGDVVLVAVSGGRDSMALLHVMARLRAAGGWRLVAHGVDHGLRPGAEAELDRAAHFARTLEVPFDRTRVAVARGSNVQARARDARWEALEAAAAKAEATSIATAHHADDRAETVLLRLLRGAGARGLAVLPPRAGARIRPLLRARRAQIDAHVARHAVPYSDDPSNLDPRHLRVRVRREVLPLLATLDPRIVEHLCAIADDVAPLAGSADRTYTLPRATALALARLRDTRSPHARIQLPGGLVAMLAVSPQRSHVPSQRRR